MKTFARMTILLAAALCIVAGAMNTSAGTGGQVSLNVPFDPDRLTYSATVSRDVTEITVMADARHPSATVRVNGGDPNAPVPLAMGENTIWIVVTAEDGRTWLTYTVTVTRGAAATDMAATTQVSIFAGAGVTEGGNTTFTLTASPAPTAALTVEVTVSQSGDYAASGATGSRSVTFPTGATATFFAVATVDDGTDEPDGSVTAALAAGIGYTVSPSQGAATVAVVDNDDAPSANPNAALIAKMYGWRDNSEWSWDKVHTDRWDRALLALGETVADSSLTPMTAAEAQAFADRGWTPWVEVAAALHALESGAPDSHYQDPAPVAQEPPGQLYASLIADVQGWRNDPNWVTYKEHTDRWDRVLLALGERVSDTSLTPMTPSEAQDYVGRGWTRWTGVVQALNAVITGTSGDDTLTGTSSGELLAGLAGADILYGLEGEDELRGGDGDDTYTGGAGRDRFVFIFGDTGAKVITDFASGDVIVMKGGGWQSVSDITNNPIALGSLRYRYNLAGGLTVDTTNNRPLRSEDFILE